MSRMKRTIDDYEEQQYKEEFDIEAEDFMFFPLYRQDDWLNEYDEWPDDEEFDSLWEEEHD